VVALAAYAVGRCVGGGAMAEVYAATRRCDGINVAVKVARAVLADDPWVAQRFSLEAHVLRRAASPGVVSVIEAGIEAGRPFLVMELATGGSLAGRIPTTATTPEILRRVAIDLAGGLEAFHGADLRHLDVNPANVLVTGVAACESMTPGDGARLLLADPSVSFLPTGARHRWLEFGTPRWRAPETGAGRSPGVAADIFGASATLWGVMTGSAPPEEAERSAIIGSMPRHWREVFGPGLAASPTRRHPCIGTWVSSVLGAIERDLACADA
jgi:serine/threonine-protein kinase